MGCWKSWKTARFCQFKWEAMLEETPHFCWLPQKDYGRVTRQTIKYREAIANVTALWIYGAPE